MIRTRIQGLEGLTKRLGGTGAKARRLMQKRMQRAVLLVQNEAVRSIQSGGTGQAVVRYNPTRRHVASAPGSPPATDTGHLVANISTDVEVVGRREVVGSVISGASYSKALEYGYAPNNLEPRPFMRPALEKQKTKVDLILGAEGGIF